MLKREDMVFVCLGLDFMQDFLICFSLHGKIVERVKVFFKFFFNIDYTTTTKYFLNILA